LSRDGHIALGLTLLATAIYAFRLGVPSLRGDEAFTAVFTQWTLSEIVHALRTTEPHPPAYYVFIHIWTRAMGDHEFILRLPSLIGGILCVPLTYALGRAWKRPWAGLWASALVALNPFLIWHAQDARMYTFLTVSGLGSIWFAAQLASGRKTGANSLGYVLTTLLALTSHYYALFLLAAQNMAWVVGWLTRWYPRRRAKSWLGTQAALALLYLPWLAIASGFILGHNKDWIPSIDLLALGARLGLAFSMGTNVSTQLAIPGLFVYAILFLTGLVIASRRDIQTTSWPTLLIGAAFVLPIGLTFGISLWRPIFDERYLIYGLPLFLLLVGRGLAWIGEQRPGVPVILFCFLALFSLHSLYTYHYDPQRTKSPAWRAAMAYLKAHQQPDDVLILNYPDPAQEYYNRKMIEYVLLPASYPVDLAATETALQKLKQKHSRIWLLPVRASNWDAQGQVEAWLNRYTDRVAERFFPGLKVQLYHTPRRFRQTMVPTGAIWGDHIRLLGYRLSDETLTPGATLQVTLYWTALATMDTDYTVFVHLLGPEGILRGQEDSPPLDGTWPTSAWQPGELLVDRYEISVDPQAPLGVYMVRVGMYTWPSMAHLPVQTKADSSQRRNDLPLVEIQVARD
jgi:hypothetical protein